ncbi:hypothetical protein BJX65DRAFT_307095 [Aspergillus insuetus]
MENNEDRQEDDPGTGETTGTGGAAADQNTGGSKPLEHDDPPIGPWGNRGVTSRKAGTKKAPDKSSSLNVRVNLDLRADVALELHAVIQGDITIGAVARSKPQQKPLPSECIAHLRARNPVPGQSTFWYDSHEPPAAHSFGGATVTIVVVVVVAVTEMKEVGVGAVIVVLGIPRQASGGAVGAWLSAGAEHDFYRYPLGPASAHAFKSKVEYEATVSRPKKLHKDHHRIVFTHGDLKAHNILIHDDGHLSWFLD